MILEFPSFDNSLCCLRTNLPCPEVGVIRKVVQQPQALTIIILSVISQIEHNVTNSGKYRVSEIGR